MAETTPIISQQEDTEKVDYANGYYGLYLKKYFADNDDPRLNDLEYITSHAELAATTFEQEREHGADVFEAQESAMHVLLADLIQEEFDALAEQDAKEAAARKESEEDYWYE